MPAAEQQAVRWQDELLRRRRAGASFGSAQEVIGVFDSLVWTSRVPDPNRPGGWVRHIEEIIHRYTWEMA